MIQLGGRRRRRAARFEGEAHLRVASTWTHHRCEQSARRLQFVGAGSRVLECLKGKKLIGLYAPRIMQKVIEFHASLTDKQREMVAMRVQKLRDWQLSN